MPKIGIIVADRSEGRVILEADDVISLLAHLNEALSRRYWHRKDYTLWAAHTCRSQRRAGGRTSGDTIVNDDRYPARDLHAFTLTQIALTAPLDLGELAVTDDLEIRFIDPGKPNDAFIAHDEWRATIYDSTHRQLRLKGHADLADQNEIERRVECSRYLRCHGNAAAR